MPVHLRAYYDNLQGMAKLEEIFIREGKAVDNLLNIAKVNCHWRCNDSGSSDRRIVQFYDSFCF